MLDFEWFEGDRHPFFKDAVKIRTEVFVKEQLVDEPLELDGEESYKWHVIAYENQQPVATARVYFLPDDENSKLKVQRVAVLKANRGEQVGARLMYEIEKWAKIHHATHLVLSAQDTAIPFYEKIAFNVVNPLGYLDAGIPHHDMEKTL